MTGPEVLTPDGPHAGPDADATTPQPGDLVRILGPYYAVRDLADDARGRLAVIDGSHFEWDLEDGRGPICLAVLSFSCFWGPSISRRDPADDGPSYVSASGGPCPFVPLADLEPTGTIEGHYWRWKSMPEAGGGRPYTKTVRLWTWTYDARTDPTKG